LFFKVEPPLRPSIVRGAHRHLDVVPPSHARLNNDLKDKGDNHVLIHHKIDVEEMLPNGAQSLNTHHIA